MVRAAFEAGDAIHGPGVVYRVQRVLGSGGMGAVYEVTDKNLGSNCVLKMLHPDLARQRPGLVERFEKEARALAKLRHPSIVRVLHLARVQDATATPFYVMELLDGQSLRDALERRGALRIDVSINLAIGILYGLYAAHERGVIHRDIKPENVIVHKDASTGEVLAKLIDFGVMRLVTDDAEEGFCGTPAYAAPEQLRMLPLTTKADVYSATAVLFEMLTGRRVYAEYGLREQGSLMRAELEAPSISKFGQFPPALADWVARGLSLDPTTRPDAFELAAKLEQIGRALDRVYQHDHAVTAEDFGRTETARESGRLITLADLEAPTDPDGPVPPWMVALRQNAELSQILGQPVQLARFDGPAFASTEPGAPVTPTLDDMRNAETREASPGVPRQPRMGTQVNEGSPFGGALPVIELSPSPIGARVRSGPTPSLHEVDTILDGLGSPVRRVRGNTMRMPSAPPIPPGRVPTGPMPGSPASGRRPASVWIAGVLGVFLLALAVGAFVLRGRWRP